jgi:hypothetical protein
MLIKYLDCVYNSFLSYWAFKILKASFKQITHSNACIGTDIEVIKELL